MKNSLKQWENLRSKYNHNILDWWEYLVKPKIRDIAIFHSREINKSKTGHLNLLILKQLHFSKMVRLGNQDFEVQLKSTNVDIKNYFEEEAKSLQLLINMRDITESEKTNIYHHSLHRKKVQRAFINKIQEGKNYS